jgi:hypothetical protein
MAGDSHTTKQWRIALRFTLVIAALFALSSLIYCSLAHRQFLHRYATAELLPPTGSIKSATWDYTVPLPRGGSAHIQAKGGMGGSVEVLYESERHLIYRYEDYIYPVELKLSLDKRVLFATVQGWGAGLVRACRTYEFDLHERHVVSKHRNESIKPAF